jgi:alkylation response protein AidB-like acyl-CoA dehydrogenase
VHIAFTEEQESLRATVRAYFDELMTPEVTEECATGETGGPASLEAVRKMGADGWLGIGWPTSYGGQGRTPLEQYIFTNESWRANAPTPFLTINAVGRTIQEFGSDEQKDFFLPAILAGRLHFAIGYTEPSAGTDLASLTTRAVRDGDEWVLNGAKTFTSLASYADYIWLAARTDPDAPKHKGITIFAVPTDTPGFSYTKIPTMVNASTYQTFYDEVRVGPGAVIGEVNRGWDLIVNQLNFERISLAPTGSVMRAYEGTLDRARRPLDDTGRRRIDDEWVRTNLARVRAGIDALELMNWKAASATTMDPALSSAIKVYGTEFFGTAYRLLAEVIGPRAAQDRTSPLAVLEGGLARAMQGSLILTFGGGVNEIQRDLIAMFGLGMPRTPRM